MIVAWHAGPIDRPQSANREARRASLRGGPLAMIAVLMGAWIGGRLLAWESPLLEQPAIASAKAQDVLPEPMSEPARPRRRLTGAMSYADPYRDPLFGAGAGAGAGLVPAPWAAAGAPMVRYVMVPAMPAPFALGGRTRGPPQRYPAAFAMGPADGPAAMPAQAPMAGRTEAASASDRAALHHFGRISGEDLAMARAQDPIGAPGAVPFGGPAARMRRPSPDRWSLDAWAFLRQGSDAAPISQGRVPIYGASQIGAVAQWRARPGSAFDPRLYARAYRALVANGETELATGASLRPVPSLPLRAAGELRITQSPFSTDVRPAGYVFTELAPFAVAGKVTGELFAGGGYVGGEADTGFVDGQFTLMRPLIDYNPAITRQLRLSVGAGAWGGAQEGANRLDLGPTMRLDMLFGKVPARVSLDWRERVTGDAAPESGVAATVSASF